MATDIFDFDSCVNQRESVKVRSWGSEGYEGSRDSSEQTTSSSRMTRKKRKHIDLGYCPLKAESKKRAPAKRKKVTKRKKLTLKQLNSIQIGTRLKLYWPPTKTWSYGEVINIYDDGMYEIACHDDPEDQGPLCYHLADYRIKILDSPDELEYYDPETKPDPHPEASRRSPRKPKKRKLFDMDLSPSQPKKAVGASNRNEVRSDVMVEKGKSETQKQNAMVDTAESKIEPEKQSVSPHSNEQKKNIPKRIPNVDTSNISKTETSDPPTHDNEGKSDGDGKTDIAVALNRSR